MRPYLSIAISAALATSFVLLSPPAPAVAQQMPIPELAHYGDLPAIQEARISPNGTYTAMLMTSGGDRYIGVMDAAGKPVKRIAVGDAKVRDIEWVGEHAILLLRTETGRLPRHYLRSEAEFLRGNVIPLDDNRPVVSIFAKQRNIANAIAGFYGVREVDGRWIGYFGGYRRGSTSGSRDQLLDRQPALYAIDLDSGDDDLVALPDDWPSTRDWLVDDNGEIGATLQFDTYNGNWRIEDSKGKTIARGKQERGEISMLGFSSDNTAIIYSYFDDATQERRRFKAPMAEENPQEIWNEESIDRFVFAPNSRRVLGIQRRNGDVALDDPTAQAALTQAFDAFSYASNTVVFDFTPDFTGLIAKTSGNYDSGTWYRMDSVSGARSILGVERPTIQGPVIGKVSTFTYKAQDGLEIEGILTLPPGRAAENLPVVILPHGGPTSHDEEAFDWWAQAFASKGYAVLQPNFRGSTGRGRAFVDAGDGEWGGKMQTDKSDGITALAEQGIVDPNRACIVGASYGGYAALAGVTLQQDIYRCAVSVNGVADLEPLLRYLRNGSNSTLRRSVEKQFGGRPNLDALSPTANARNGNAPVLLIHSRKDTVVPIAQSFLMKDALEDANRPVTFVELEGDDHHLSFAETRQQMLEASVNFVMEHNPPD